MRSVLEKASGNIVRKELEMTEFTTDTQYNERHIVGWDKPKNDKDCNHNWQRDDTVVLTTYPPKYIYVCSKCGAKKTDYIAEDLHPQLEGSRGLNGKPEFDNVDRPYHYAKGSLECIDWIRAMLSPEEYRGYLKGATLKYIWRHEDKGTPTQDLEKARKYLSFLIEELDREKNDV